MKLKAIDISVFVTLIICIIATVSFENDCKGIREEILRLHVIANSDSDADQQLKLSVRDAVLKAGETVFSGSEDIISAEGRIAENTGVLLNCAKQTIAELGYDYDVKIELKRSYFPTRVYDDITLPAGYYKAVRIIIGEGKGKNWWCIMFPPLCLPAARDNKETVSDFLTDEEMQIVTANHKYEVRFWLIEKYYDIKNRYFVENK
ncbi:MAG: stage II sporulation protein R [Clostridia bacterium]|nr:stage II sporulation protein R [Clostridia bacterium]